MLSSLGVRRRGGTAGYRFYTQEMYDDRWQDPEFRKRYEDRATPVTVGKAETQNVRIRAIAAQDIK